MKVNTGGRPSTQRDRLNAYVEPATTKAIQDLQLKLFEETGLRVTIGQAVDYFVKFYQKESK